MLFFSGIQKFTLLDFPGKTACILFLPGCNLRCRYCYNSQFVIPEKIKKICHSFIPEDIILNFLKKRKGLLEGVVISGGEPTIHPSLIKFILKVRELGFKIKLDTNGGFPDRLNDLIEKKFLDYIAMDYKAPLDSYSLVVGQTVKVENIKQSKEIIMNGRVPYEFRTTLVKKLHKEKDILEIAKEIKGAEKYYLQKFKPIGDLLDLRLKASEAFSNEFLEEKAKQCLEYVKRCEVR